MRIEHFIAIGVTLLLLVAFPIGVIWEFWRTRHVKASDRPTRTSAAAGFLDALERLIRPSVEHQIEEENRVVKDEDDIGGM